MTTAGTGGETEEDKKPDKWKNAAIGRTPRRSLEVVRQLCTEH